MRHKLINKNAIKKNVILLLNLFLLIPGFLLHAQDPEPPSQPVRSPAEFEPVQSVFMQWDFSHNKLSFKELHLYLIENIIAAGAEVIIMATDKYNDVNNIIDYLKNIGGLSQSTIDTKVKLLVYHDLTAGGIYDWPRDYLCQTIYSNTINQMGLVDWNYYGGEQANFISEILRNEYYNSYNLFKISRSDPDVDEGFNLQGGNFVTDGFGALIATKDILTWWTKMETIERTKRYLKNYCGINENKNFIYPEYIIPEDHEQFDNLSSFIGHTDLYFKFIDEETIVYANYSGADPQSIALREGVESIINFINDDLTSIYNRPFNFIPIESPPPKWEIGPGGPDPTWFFRSYVNFLIVNDHVLFPIYGEGYNDLDDAAISTVKSLLPGYKIKPFLLPLSEYDAFLYGGGYIHCYTHEINRENPVIPNNGNPIDEVISTGSYDYFEHFVSKGSLTTEPDVTIEPDGFVVAKTDGTVYLQPGFTAKNGSFFRASIAR